MILFNRYEYNPQTDLIGKGRFSRVYKAFDKQLNRHLALKIYKRKEFSERFSAAQNIQQVIELDHPNICRYTDIQEIEKEDSFGQVEKIQVCVMELLEGGNLEHFYTMLPDLKIFKKLLIDVLQGLAYLHRHGIIHCGVKAANILITQSANGPIARITDFGTSKKADVTVDSTSSSIIASIPYMAPEQLNPKKYGINDKVNYNLDLWSLGVTVYELLGKDMLFRTGDNDSSEQIMSNIFANELPQKIKTLPEPFRQFVERCIVKDANQRIKTAEELLPILEPPEMHHPESHPGSRPVQGSSKEDARTLQPDGPGTAGNIIIPASEPDNITAPETPPEILSGAETTNIEKLDFRPLEPEASDDDTRLVSIPLEERDTGNIVQTARTGDSDVGGNADLPPGEPDEKGSDTKVLPEVGENDVRQTETTTEIISKLPPKSIGDETVAIAKPTSEKEHSKVTLFNRYEYYPATDLIGKGGFSRVYKAFDQKLSRWVALKIYKTTEFSERYSPTAEIKRVVNLDHSNICRYLDIEEIEKVNPFGEIEKIQVCVMELLDSGNFSDYFNKSGKDPEIFKKLLQDVLRGLAYLHKNGIIHRDIKPANILIKNTIDGPVAKITDFGISKASDSVNNNSSSALIVSIPYMAPEQLNTKKYGIKEKISSNLDLWSLGVTIYEVFTGKVLFKNSEQDSSEQIMANIMAPDLPEKINELPETLRNIVSCCIVKDANDRVQKAEELLVLLNSAKTDSQPIVPPYFPFTSATNSASNTAPYSETNKSEDLTGILPKGEPQQPPRKFAIDEPIPEHEKRAKKHISVLTISVAAATVLFIIVLLLYFKVSKEEEAISGVPIKRDTLKNIPAVVVKNPVLNDERKDDTIAKDSSPVKKTSSNDEAAREKEPAAAKLKKQADKVAKRTRSEAVGSAAASDKFLVTFFSLENCTLYKNGSYAGKVQAKKDIHLPLKPGAAYAFRATNERNLDFKITIDVPEDMAGKRERVQIRF